MTASVGGGRDAGRACDRVGHLLAQSRCVV